MTAENFTTVLEGLRTTQPFRVFTVESDGGRKAVFLAPGGLPVWFDHESVLRVVGAGSQAEA